MKAVSVLGDLVIDNVLRIDGFPVLPSRHQQVHDFYHGAGGAANTLIMGARLGLPMQSLAVIGDDEAGASLLKYLKIEGVGTDAVFGKKDVDTAIVFTLVGEKGEHVFLGFQRKNQPMTEFPDFWARAIQDSSVLFFDGWTYQTLTPSITLDAADIACREGVPVFFDPGPEFPHFSQNWLKSILGRTFGLVLTIEEASGLLDVQSHVSEKELAKRLLSFGPKLVAIKLGEKGCYLMNGKEEALHEGFSVPVVDTSGAGDVVAAALMFSYLAKFNLHEACVMMNAAGAATVKKLGAGSNVATLNEVFQFLDKYGYSELRGRVESIRMNNSYSRKKDNH